MNIGVLVLKEGDQWSAQCLEYDIVAQAASLDELDSSLRRAVVGHIVSCKELNLKPFEGLKQAPKEFWKRFNESPYYKTIRIPELPEWDIFLTLRRLPGNDVREFEALNDIHEALVTTSFLNPTARLMAISWIVDQYFYPEKYKPTEADYKQAEKIAKSLGD